MPHPSKSAKGIARPAIANLLQVPRYYRLVDGTTIDDPLFLLVNEKLEEFSLKGQSTGHTRDELIKMIGAAYPEFVALVKEYETALLELQTAKGVAVDLYRTITGTDNLTPDSISYAETVMRYYKQTWDVIRSLACNVLPSNCKAIAIKHYERVKGFVECPANILVNENGENGNIILLTDEEKPSSPTKEG